METRKNSAALVLAAAAACGCGGGGGGGEPTGEAPDRVVGGVVATPNEWPGMVTFHRIACGGTLVAPTWIVTAAHCVRDPSSVQGGFDYAILGRYDLTIGTDGEQIAVKRAFRHEAYDETSGNQNDIGLIELARPSTLPVARLVSRDEAGVIDGGGALATVVGWGATSKDGTVLGTVLMQANIPIVANAECRALPGYGSVIDSMVCAGNRSGGGGPCYGDSGGPLFVRVGSEPVQVGIVSWGVGCADPNAPGVFTRSSAYLDWMRARSGGAIDGVPALRR